ncbi:MAG: transposase [Terriglobia bacterium]
MRTIAIWPVLGWQRDGVGALLAAPVFDDAVNRGDHHRRSIRLRGYDYSSCGFYFVTVCTENRECALGEIVSGSVALCGAGRIVSETWASVAQRFSTVALDDYVVMPNHVHGIIQLAAPNGGLRAQQAAPLRRGPTLGEVIRGFKSISAVSVNRLLGRSGRAFWQRNYYEHLIRNQRELDLVRQYIAQNPLRWTADRENPHAHHPRDDSDLAWEE